MYGTFQCPGRAFVVGDLHGCLPALRRALHRVDFTPDRGDLLLSVGDLVDRGPNSLACLQLLTCPWFHAVMGNHERMLLDALRGYDPAAMALWQYNGGTWWRALSAAQRRNLLAWLPRIAALPLALECRLADGARVGLVHGDPVVLTWPELRRKLLTQPDPDFCQQLLWQRNRLRRVMAEPDYQPRMQGLDLLCLGHTPLPAPLKRGNLLWLDTGAYLGGPLSLLPVRDWL
ncbi:metallophosphoesterase [Pseudaeromonas sp. ZJS20]|uniref:metallophosphoesterase n=1 Tax=Pseudaeromonas aegiceratis TaxID=3153928 RepID=UPI00390C48B5